MSRHRARSSPLLCWLGLGYAASRVIRGLKPGADDDFFDWKGPELDGATLGLPGLKLPVKYYRDDSFAGFFSAALEPARAMLPSPDLEPVRLPGGRALVAVFAFNYQVTDIGPYGEIAVTIPCTLEKQAPPVLPLVLEARYPTFGAFVVHLPVTSRVARDPGRAVYGFTKFISDMAFEKQPAFQRVRLSEGGRHILTLTVRQSGITMRDNRPLVTYSALGGQLLRTSVPTRSLYQLGIRRGNATLELGDHPVADDLRLLDVDSRSAISRNYLTRVAILPAGEPVGSAREHVGYQGADADYGKLTVSYGGDVIDLYAHV
jgi:hypothetical protein